ncbi:MAG: relaxase domain-containing protein [Micropruina sp.]|nr:relaxase domain-containing protein [Micropruina sp.]
MKSVSTLWALAEPSTAATIERAHLAAIGDALRFIETHALYTRTGHNGVRQVDVTGLIAARFTHRDSRAGDPEALGFYLDNHRVHVGDLGTCADQVFDSWLTARQAAPTPSWSPPPGRWSPNSTAEPKPTRGGGQPSRTVALADGSDAAVGDVIITRLNDRRLRTSGTDWVRNGDRWTITGIATNGDLRAIHQTNRQTVILPAGYVTESVELGYACTIHGAQGVTADVLHGIATGAETRQQLYTMLTRGRYANQVHLEVVGDGDAHSLIRPEAILPPTATDLLRRILARDEDNTSATTTARTLAAPANRLADAVARYSDAPATPPNRPQAPTSSSASNRPPTSSSPDSPTPRRGPRCAPICS